MKRLLSKAKRKVKLGLNSVRAATGGYRQRCPVCGNRTRGFIPLEVCGAQLFRELRASGFDMGLMEQFETLNLAGYACPNCYASDRERLYALYIRQSLQRVPTPVTFRLLDIAPCASLREFIRKAGRFQYRSADLFMPNVDDKVDIQDMRNYADGSFDWVICSHVLEHVPDDRKAMREIRRVLAPGGRAILMVPILPKLEAVREDPSVTDAVERTRRFGQSDHVRLYSKAGFLERLAEAGFDVQALPATDFGAERLVECGITPVSVLYVAKKPADKGAN